MEACGERGFSPRGGGVVRLRGGWVRCLRLRASGDDIPPNLVGGGLLSVCGTVEHPPSGEGPCLRGGHGREVTLSQMGPPFLDILLWAARLAGVSFWDHSCGHVFWW